jgi:outer membrane protein assembly factor BamA
MQQVPTSAVGTSAEQEKSNGAPEPESDSKKPPDKKKVGRGSIVAAPLPISSPALGAGVIPVLGYIFPFSLKDKVSPPSVIGAAGLFTSNGSRGFAVGGQLYIDENRYEVEAGYADGNVNYNLYGGDFLSGLQGAKLPLKQDGRVFFGEGLRNIGHKLFVGPRVWIGTSVVNISLQNNEVVPPPEIGLHSELVALGLIATRDTSTNRFYPTQGSFLEITGDFFSQGLGSKYSFQAYRFKFDKYFSLSPKQVLAYDAFVCLTGGSPPFYGNCIYGANNELRGYTAGQYLDRYMLANQLEYRQVLPARFGFVLFGGLGGVIPGSDQLRNSHFLPDIGAGLRFQLNKKYHVNLRVDAAKGNGSYTWAMGVGEAF